MKIGFIGAGKAGCSLGKYFSQKTLPDCSVIGFYSKEFDDAVWAANFTNSKYFTSLEALVSECDTIIISTQDSVIEFIWRIIPKEALKGKIICHLSGSLSSDVFSDRESYGAYGISIHPLFAFSNKESVYKQLNNVYFTLEGDSYAIKIWQKLLSDTGNQSCLINKTDKIKYHAAASILSNHVLAVIDCGYQLLMSCGFDELQARNFTADLIITNISHAVERGTVNALTGPIERCDAGTVKKHLYQLEDSQREIYYSCGKRLLEMAQQKNPDHDYSVMKKILKME